MKEVTLKKSDACQKTGAGGDSEMVLSELGEAVLDAIGCDSASVVGLPVRRQWETSASAVEQNPISSPHFDEVQFIRVHDDGVSAVEFMEETECPPEAAASIRRSRHSEWSAQSANENGSNASSRSGRKSMPNSRASVDRTEDDLQLRRELLELKKEMLILNVKVLQLQAEQLTTQNEMNSRIMKLQLEQLEMQNKKLKLELKIMKKQCDEPRK